MISKCKSNLFLSPRLVRYPLSAKFLTCHFHTGENIFVGGGIFSSAFVLLFSAVHIVSVTAAVIYQQVFLLLLFLSWL